MTTCPCGRPLALGACCGRVHGGAVADSPEALMRSRYSAYALGLRRYLLDSWHSTTRPERLTLDLDVVWTGLTVVEAVGDEVLFEARFTRDGEPGTLVERSRFAREDGHWRYLDGR